MSNYQEEIENLKNNSQNNLQNLGSNNINSNLINNNNINFPKQNPLFKNDISFGNPNEKDNELTIRRQNKTSFLDSDLFKTLSLTYCAISLIVIIVLIIKLVTKK